MRAILGHVTDGVTAAVTSESGELGVLRRAMREAPYPVWSTGEDGKVIWFNRAYETLCSRTRPATDDSNVLPFQLADAEAQAGK